MVFNTIYSSSFHDYKVFNTIFSRLNGVQHHLNGVQLYLIVKAERNSVQNDLIVKAEKIVFNTI